MKKILCIFLITLTIFAPIIALASDASASLEVNSEDILANAKSGLLMDYSSGKIIYEKNMNDKLAVASMTKMMAQIIILEQIKEGKLSWDEKITVSTNAAGMGGSQIWLEANEVISISDLMKGVSMASANDAVVALGERIAGTEKEFVSMLNQKAKELNLQNTNFVNATGLDEDNHYSTAYDMGTIARELLKNEEILKFSSVYEDYIRLDKPNKFWIVNTNKLVRTYPGVDGLKTGNTDNAGYCMAATAKRNGLRLIAIALGEKEGSVRNKEVANLLDMGFNIYKTEILKQKNEVIGKINVEKSDEEEVELILTDDLGLTMKKSEKLENYKTEININRINIPIKKGEIVGEIVIKENGKIIAKQNITINKNLKKASLTKLYLRIIKDILVGK